MKTIKTTTPKALIATFMLAGLLMTGCSGNNEGNGGNNTPAPSATATASASETAAPTATGTPQPTSTYKNMQEATQEDKEKLLAGFAAKPLGVDVDEVMENRLADDVLTTFPQDEFKTKEGVTAALNTYQELVSITNWVHARNGADDTSLIEPFGAATDKTAAFDAQFMNKMKERIAKEGQFAHIPTVSPDGTLKIDGVVYHTEEASLMNSKSNQPAVEVSRSGDALHIEGTRYLTISFGGDKTLVADRGYFIDAVPAGDSGQWLITNFGETYKEGIDTLKVVSDAEAAAWFAKAGTDG